jgi:sugar lactone lactonase YvrE
MKKLLAGFISLFLVSMASGAAWADKDNDFVTDRDAAELFATLPTNGPGFPEGIAADRAGNIYVATFDFSTTNVIHIFGRNGHRRVTIPLPGVVPLGMEFDAAGNLYVADFGGGNVLKFSPPFTAASTPSASFPVCGGQPNGCGLNAITFDAAGDLYVSDSFGGNIFKVDLPVGTSSTFFSDERLKPGDHAFPGFGANGLAFGNHGSNLYIANTADDRVFRLNVATKTLSAFAESINGADGIVFDRHGRLWVAANQNDEIVGVNENGRVFARLGDFKGIGKDGAPKGLLFPASLVIVGDELFVTNLALPLTSDPNDEQEDGVTRWTVSRVKLTHH